MTWLLQSRGDCLICHDDSWSLMQPPVPKNDGAHLPSVQGFRGRQAGTASGASSHYRWVPAPFRLSLVVCLCICSLSKGQLALRLHFSQPQPQDGPIITWTKMHSSIFYSFCTVFLSYKKSIGLHSHKRVEQYKSTYKIILGSLEFLLVVCS